MATRRKRFVQHMVKVVGRDECTSREILNRLVEAGRVQMPDRTQIGMILKSCGYFDKVRLDKTKGKAWIWKVRLDKAIEAGWLAPDESD